MTSKRALAIQRVNVVGQLPPPIHGSAVMTERLVEALTNSGHSVRVVDKRFSSSVRDVGRIHPRKLLQIPSLIVRMLATRFSRGQTVYFLTDRPASFLVDLLISSLAGRPLIHYLHTSGFTALASRGPLWRFAVKRVLNRSNSIVILGESLESDIRQLAPNKRLVIIPNPANDTLKRAMPPERPRVLFLSNLLEEKGADTFIKVARSLTVRHPLIAWDFQLAGEGDSSSFDTDGIPLTILGKVDHETRDDLFATSTVLVFPSRYRLEAQPLTIVEAMAFGLPVVAFEVGGISDLIGADNPLLIRLGDDEELAQQVVRLSTNRSDWEAESRAARRRYEAAHTTEDFSRRWVKALHPSDPSRKVRQRGRNTP